MPEPLPVHSFIHISIIPFTLSILPVLQFFFFLSPDLNNYQKEKTKRKKIDHNYGYFLSRRNFSTHKVSQIWNILFFNEVRQDIIYRLQTEPHLFRRAITGDELWIFEYDSETKSQSSLHWCRRKQDKIKSQNQVDHVLWCEGHRP